ncbi:nuclear transport factor 2 family protein [Streptomyces sp. NPDC050546]|uniref:nuclear transport factor 2 family protein n=1 Tax=Streptomyces sp. NPDC050546 TaxID=3365628 RepID=UPI0037BC2827
MNQGPEAAAQEPGEDTVRAFTDLARDWAAAIVANDPVRIAGFMADEWVIVSESGIDPKERFLSVVRSGELTHSAMGLRTRPRVRVYGDTAVVTGRVTNTAHYRGERYDADEWTTDVFVKRDGRWQCVLSQITSAAPGTTAAAAGITSAAPE